MKCKNCTRVYIEYDEEAQVSNGPWCDKIFDSPDMEEERDCMWYNPKTHGDMVRRMNDEELAEFIEEVVNSRGCCACDQKKNWFCEKSEWETCKECIKRWLQKKSLAYQ